MNLSSIRVKNLNFQYDIDHPVFRDVSFLISPGEKVALMGRNGAGKSTLCKMLVKETEPDEGSILIPAGVDIVYVSQVMKEQFSHWTMQDYLLEAKGLRGKLQQYFLLLELMAIDNSMKSSLSLQERGLGGEAKLSALITSFSEFLDSYHLPELQVSEECAVELMCEIEELENLDELKKRQMLKFLQKCPDGEMVLNLEEFMNRFEVYFDFLCKKHEFQFFAKEHFSTEMMELLGDLQEQYETVGAYDIEEEMRECLELVGLNHLERNTRIELLSGGQKNRLMLAQGILKNPDILILDEPTNNLDKNAYNRLSEFVKTFKGTLIVISHDADFLNNFVEKVLYIDAFEHSIREYHGTYENVREEVAELMERERREQAKLSRELKRKKEIAHKRTQQAAVYSSAKNLSASAKKMRAEVEELEEKRGKVLQEDKPISPFLIPCEVLDESLMAIDYIGVWDGEEEKLQHYSYQVEKSQLVLIHGTNGTGKSHFLRQCIQLAQREKLIELPEAMNGDEDIETLKKRIWFSSNAEVGYYSQDFSTLNFEHTVQQSMEEVHSFRYQDMRSTLARFQFTEKMLQQKVGELSEGQKALLSWARLVFLEPNLLILDEPTNHVNFRHLPIIQEALKKYRGTIVLVCHDTDFIKNLPIAMVLDMQTGKKIKGRDFFKKAV